MNRIETMARILDIYGKAEVVFLNKSSTNNKKAQAKDIQKKISKELMEMINDMLGESYKQGWKACKSETIRLLLEEAKKHEK